MNDNKTKNIMDQISKAHNETMKDLGNLNKPTKTKWLAGYPNYMDWYIVPDTPENREAYADFDGDEYETFQEAKNAISELVKDRILLDKRALKYIKKVRKKAACLP